MHDIDDVLPTPTRRGFIICATGAGFAMAFALPQPGLAADTTAGAGTATPFEPTIWYELDRDGIVTVNIIRAEMGQHVGTALARRRRCHAWEAAPCTSAAAILMAWRMRT